MTLAFPKQLVFDVGRSYTKAFVVNNDKNSLTIEKKDSLPTSLGDIDFCAKKLMELLKTKDIPVIVTGNLPEAETLANHLGGDYVPGEESLKQVYLWLEKNDFKKPVILDAGSYHYSSNLKASQIGAFLTQNVTEADIENYFGNKSIRPQAIPTTQAELEMEEAFYRVVFSRNPDFIKSPEQVNILVTGAYFSLAPKQSKLALILLDILYKGKVAQVKLDKELFLYGFGSLLKKYPAIADWEVDFLKELGAFVSFGGKGEIRMDYGFSEAQEITIVEDEIALVPAPSNQKIKLSFLNTKEKKKIEVNGGSFGILLDGRVKPLRIAFGREDSRESLTRWEEAIAKVEMIE